MRVDRRCEVRVLVCLAEVDERKLFLAEGYSSLFGYATAVLRMSGAQAYLRMLVALYVRNDNRRATLIKLVATCGPLDIDDPQPAITVMLPDED